MLATGDDILAPVITERKDWELVGLALFAEDVLEQIKLTGPDLVIIADELDPHLRTSKRIRLEYPDLRLIYIITDENNPVTSDDLLKMGIYDILPGVFKKKDLLDLIANPRSWQDTVSAEQLLEQLVEEPGEEAPKVTEMMPAPKLVYKQKILVFWNPKPGTGKTFLASGVALALAQKGLNVGFLDGDLNNLCAPYWLGVENKQFPLHKAIRSGEESRIQALGQPHPLWPNLIIYSGTIYCRPESYSQFEPEQFRSFINRMKSCFDVIIIDTASDLKLVSTYIALQEASEVIIPVNQDYCQLLAIKRYLQLWQRLNMDSGKIYYWPNGINAAVKPALSTMMEILPGRWGKLFPDLGSEIFEHLLAGEHPWFKLKEKEASWEENLRTLFPAYQPQPAGRGGRLWPSLISLPSWPRPGWKKLIPKEN
ncbi:MAG: AAA family ATPase [Bacillota bacterium]|nr:MULTISPECIES: AAA family ATPase [Carboxydocella]